MDHLLYFLKRNTLASVGLLLLALLLLMVLGGPWLTEMSPVAVNMSQQLLPPSWMHPLGTDYFGRDVWVRVIYGGRYTLAIGAGVVMVAFMMGVSFGIVAGFVGGWVDTVIMRSVDALLSLAIALAAAFGPSLTNAMLAVAITLAPQFARVARAQALAISVKPYVEAAHCLGVSTPRILWHYVLRNGMGPLLVQASLALGSAILQTASLGFLGLGAQPPAPEWGADVSANLPYLRASAWVALSPGVAILLAVLSFNLLGDALADWFNPRKRHAP